MVQRYDERSYRYSGNENDRVALSQGRGRDSHHQGGGYTSSGQYRGDGRYAREQYSRADYKNQYSRNMYSYHKPPQKKGRSRVTALVMFLLIAVIAVGIFAYIHTLPVTIILNGRSVEVAYDTTYQKLHDSGLLKETNGDLLAVDGTVITEGAGETYQIFDNDALVENYKKRVTDKSVITEARGADVTEEADYTETTIPWTWDVDTSGGTLGVVVEEGTDGVERTSVGKVSGKTVTETTVQMVPRTVRYFKTELTGDQKVVALTFDDGPSDYTGQVLSLLTQYGAVATFFQLGASQDEYPTIAKAVVDQGSQVATHTYSHDYEFASIGAMSEEIAKGEQATKNTTGVSTTTVRMPGGTWIHDDQWSGLKDVLSAYVYWDVETRDWSKPGADAIANTVTSKVTNGSIVLMHDGGGDRTQTLEALAVILPALQQEGYTFITIDELADMYRQQYQAEQAAITANATGANATEAS